MQLKSNSKHVFTSFSTKPTNNYRIFCGNKQIQSKYIYTDFTISSFHRPTTHSPLKSTATLAPRTNPPKTALSLVLLPLNRSY
nr:MAG TPA: hypothetical protein [Caudoviricetes sp.]